MYKIGKENVVRFVWNMLKANQWNQDNFHVEISSLVEASVAEVLVCKKNLRSENDWSFSETRNADKAKLVLLKLRDAKNAV